MPSWETLRREVRRLAERASAAGQAFGEDLARVTKRIERGAARLVADPPAPARTRQEVRAMLEAAGFDTAVAKATAQPFDDVEAGAQAVRNAAGVRSALSAPQTARLAAMRALTIDDLLEEGDLVTREITRAIVRSTFGGVPVRRTVEHIASRIDVAEARIRTLYDTSVSIYGRQVEAVAAGDAPDTRFLYSGPSDAKTREFCTRHVGRIYTRAEIDALDNEQLDNVFLTGGGYNCRHVWIEVSRFAPAQDIETGDRVTASLVEG